MYLSDRERRVLDGIEHQLTDTSPSLDRQMRIHAWRSTPHQSTPRLPLAMLILGVVGLLTPMFASSIPVAFLLGGIAFALILYGLLYLPVNRSARFRTDGGARCDICGRNHSTST